MNNTEYSKGKFLVLPSKVINSVQKKKNSEISGF